MPRTRLVLVFFTGLCTLVILPVATNIATGELPEWAKPHTWLAWPAVGVFSVIAIGLLISEAKSNQSAGDGQTAVASGQADPNRHRMLEIVRQTWIDGYLKHSLENLARLELGLETKPDAVSRPYDLLVQPADREARPLPAGIPIGAVFDELAKTMLILGAPGAGKTTLLLELARALLDRAEQGSMSKLGRCSGRNGESRDLIVVGSQGRIPSGEQVAQRAVEGFGPGLQEPVGADLRPLHLLLLGEAPADHEVDR